MTLDRSVAPGFKIPDDIILQEPIKRTLKNGVPLYYIPTPQIDAVKIEIHAEANRGDNNPVKKLVSFFTLHLLLEGTKSKSASILDDFFDTYASEVEVVSNFEHNGLSLLTTKKHFDTVLPVFRELLTDAVFPEKELDKRKSQKALSISIQKEQNATRASQLFRQQLFGSDHAFGQIIDEEDVDAILREDLVEFYESSLWINPEIFLTGNLDEGQLNLIAEAMGDLPVANLALKSIGFENIPKSRVCESKEKSLQSSIRIGCHLIPKTHPDYHALSVFNTILGGYFGSRLIKNIREEKGHTYGIYSSIGSLRSSDYWVIMADVQKQFAEEVIEEIYKEISLLKIKLVATDELETVRNYMIGNFLSNFSSAFDLIGRFMSIHQAGLTNEFYRDQLKFIRNFKAEDILSVANKYFDRTKMVEVVVG